MIGQLRNVDRSPFMVTHSQAKYLHRPDPRWYTTEEMMRGVPIVNAHLDDVITEARHAWGRRFDEHLGEMYLQCVLRTRRFDPERGSFKSYIARNATKDVRRIRMTKVAHLIKRPIPLGAETEDGELGDFLVDLTPESDLDLKMAIEKLSPIHRAVIRGKLDDKTNKELGDELGFSEMRISQIHHAAIVRLRELMRVKAE